MNKSRFVSCFVFFLSLSHYACKENASREITTDLTREAGQLYTLHVTMGEGDFLGSLDYEDFLSVDSLRLPGCPQIIHGETDKILKLVYSDTMACEAAKEEVRMGEILLEFGKGTDSDSLVINYQTYKLNGTMIDGQRIFSKNGTGQKVDSFSGLRVRLENDLTFEVSGEKYHQLSRLPDKPLELKSTGSMQGTNPAGRNFSMSIIQGETRLFSCYEGGWAMPKSGNEIWSVSRGSGISANYSLTYVESDSCSTKARVTLPDGRILDF